MFCCHDEVLKKLHEQIECKTEETEKGVRVEFFPTDPKKTDAFKELVRLHKVFLKDCCK